MIRGIRGATTVSENNELQMLAATEEMLAAMIIANQVEAEDVAQVIITVTDDLNATFPAKVLRSFDGWAYVPVMCAKEIAVPGSLPKCIRVMMTVNTNKEQKEIQHIYLNEAVKLRPDLAIDN
ncbi:MAG TPA: chorismate mutase [Bacilli bacterium]|nr:chorismate mutase [Bacilli bacterium]